MSGPKHLWSGDWERDSEASTQELAAQRQAAPEAEPATPGPGPGRSRKRVLALAAAAAVVVAGVAVALVTLLGPSGHHANTTALASSPPTTQTAPTTPRAPSPSPIPIPPITVPTIPRMSPTPQSTTPTPTTPTPQPSPPPQPPPTPSPTPTQPTKPQSQPPTTRATLPPSTPPTDTRTVTWLGMQINTVAGAAVVETVKPGSAGDRAGLEPGDMILSVSGKSVASAIDVADAVKGLSPGTRVTLEIGYGSLLRQTTIVLGAPPVVHQ